MGRWQPCRQLAGVRAAVRSSSNASNAVSLTLQTSQLSHGFIGHRVRSAGKIQAPNKITHREFEIVGRILFRIEAGRPRDSLPKSRISPVSKRRLPDKSCGSFGKAPDLCVRKLFFYILKTVHNFPVQILPVVHSCTFQRPIIDAKSQWTNEPQSGTDRNTGATDVAGVLRNLRLIQNQMQQRLRPVAWLQRLQFQCLS